MAIDPTQLGLAVRQLRQMRGLTQQQVADCLGISVNYLSLLENGKRGITNPGLNKLALVLKVDPIIIMTLGAKFDPRDQSALGKIASQFQELIRTTMDAQSGLR